MLRNGDDFIGDAVLRVIAFHYNKKHPQHWLNRWGSNRTLSQMYEIMTGTHRMKNIKRGKYARHTRASQVEAWLGKAYQEGGVEVAILYWERLLRICKPYLNFSKKRRKYGY